MTAEWLSYDHGPVPLAIVGEEDEISYRKGAENAMQYSPAMRVFVGVKTGGSRVGGPELCV